MNNKKISAKHAATCVDSSFGEKGTNEIKPKFEIALISTPLLQNPPWTFGGLEVVLHDLAKELAKQGHKVTVFAPDNTKIDGCRIVETGKGLETVIPTKWYSAEEQMFEKIWNNLKDWKGIIHGHTWYGLEYHAKIRNPTLRICHTHHGGIRQGWLENKPFKLNTVAISNWMKAKYQEQSIPSRVVYNGVDPKRYKLKREKGDRYLWLSRISMFKSPHVAIEIAKKQASNST